MNRISELSHNAELKIITGPDFIDAAADITVAPRLLKHTAQNSLGTFARIYRPQATVAFTSRDYSTLGFSNAQEQARQLNFTPVLRSPGGRAVAYHEDSVVLDLVSNDTDPHRLVNERFLAIAEIFVEAFDRLGVTSNIGEVPREYCPGKYSVISENVKLVGSAQRIMRGGWLLSAFVVVKNIVPVREVLTRVYSELSVDMDPSTVCDLSAFAPDVSVDCVNQSLVAVFKDRFKIADCDLTVDTNGNLHEKVLV